MAGGGSAGWRRLARRARTLSFALAHGPALWRLRRALLAIERQLGASDLRATLETLDRGAPLCAGLEVAEAVRMVTLATRLWCGSRNTCLRRALLLYRVLRGQGLAAQFAVAAGLEEGALAAHAWVSLDGQDLLPGCPAGQKELWRHPAG